MARRYMLSEGAARKVDALIHRIDLVPGARHTLAAGTGGDIGAVAAGGVLAKISVATRGPRTATAYNPADGATEPVTVCPAEIAGQFPAGTYYDAYVVAIECAAATVGEGTNGD